MEGDKNWIGEESWKELKFCFLGDFFLVILREKRKKRKRAEKTEKSGNIGKRRKNPEKPGKTVKNLISILHNSTFSDTVMSA